MSEGEVKKSFDYQLEDPFEYAFKGEMKEAIFITVEAPTSKNLSQCSDLKQAFFRALPKEQSNQTSQAEKEDSENSLESIDASAIMTLISMSQDVDLKNVLIAARDLFSSGIALVDGETKVTKPILDSMSQDDLENMLGKFYINFILASWLRKLKNS